MSSSSFNVIEEEKEEEDVQIIGIHNYSPLI